MNNKISFKNIVLENELMYNDKMILHYKIEYPQFNSELYKMTILRVNKFYENKALEYQKFCENEFFNLAKNQYFGVVDYSFPIRPYEANLSYNVTFSENCIISLYFERYEFDGGAHGRTLRDSQSWNLQNNSIIKLEHLINCKEYYTDYIFHRILEQIEKEKEIYFPDYEKLIKSSFDENSFYCTDDAIIIYYQQYDIAPYVSGIREFPIYYSDCVKNPGNLCRTINQY